MKVLIAIAMLVFAGVSAYGAAAQDAVIVKTGKHRDGHHRDENRHAGRIAVSGGDHIVRIDRRDSRNHSQWQPRHHSDRDKRPVAGVDEIVWVDRHHHDGDWRRWRWQQRHDRGRQAALDGLDHIVWIDRHRHDRDWRSWRWHHRHLRERRVATIDEILGVNRKGRHRDRDGFPLQRHHHRHDCEARWIVDWRHHRRSNGKVIVCD